MERGFTLIELMVTLVVVGVLLMLGLPSFMELIQNTQIRTGAEGILDGLQTARSEAVRRNAYTQFTLGPGTGWRVTEINPPTSGLACANIATIQTRSESEGSQNVTVDVFPAGGTTVTFTPMGWTTNACTGLNVDPATAHWIQFNVGSNVLDPTKERPLEIRITANGGIRLCAPWAGDASDLNPAASAANWRLPAGDPRRC